MHYKKTIAFSVMMVVAVLLSAFMSRQQEFKAKNLKVLPKNISHEDLDKVMDGFKSALGVKCNFCHAGAKDNPRKMDFASDENPHKEIARSMLRMTAKINRKYFRQADKEGNLTNISCVSCHNGKEHPKTVTITSLKK